MIRLFEVKGKTEDKDTIQHTIEKCETEEQAIMSAKKAFNDKVYFFNWDDSADNYIWEVKRCQ